MAKDKETIAPKREEGAGIIPVGISKEMKESYLDYAMSVITSRALPDVRDGLKPVHRRILFSMHEKGLTASAKFRKSATVVGDVLGSYHPHGDSSVYEAMVKMAQDFSHRYPLVLGQGNFGCFTKDTKVRLADGRNLSFEELIAEDLQGKRNYTFTINSDGRVAIAPIVKPRRTKRGAEIMKVVLDTGESIRCTPNHRFLLKNQTYVEAQNLTSGISLMPFYARLSTPEDVPLSDMKGYEMVLQPLEMKWEFIHHLADAYNIEHGAYPMARGRVRHHKELSKRATMWQTGVSKYYDGDIERIPAEVNGNHKVSRIEFLQEHEDVYDLTVPNTHNFVLSAGVFVHNSIDGDSAAAYRYTEAKMSRISGEMLRDLDKETVPWNPNYDGTKKEPAVLPAAVPNLLLNGTLGIAVGMATSIPPHNLGEVVDATIALIDDEEATNEDLLRFVKGPDFPTGGIIFADKEVHHAYASGRGGVVCRGEAEVVETKSGQFQIIIGSIPYRVNKSDLIVKIADLVHEKKLEGIKDIRDESTKDIRVVIDLKTGVHPQKVLNFLYKHTELESTFHFNVLALVDGVPKTLSLRAMLKEFISHREIIVRKRTEFDLRKAEDREHILVGLKKALDHIDKIIKTIKGSKDAVLAHANLMKEFRFSDKQAAAILEMKLQKLAGLERKKIEDELLETEGLIKKLKELLSSAKKILKVVRDELLEAKTKYGDERRTKVIKSGVKIISEEDLIPEKESMLVYTAGGYVKRTDPGEYRVQKRGGGGVVDLDTKEEDFVTHLLSANTHSDLLFFTDKGKAYQIKMYDIPEGKRATKGKSIMNFLQLSGDEKVTSILAMPKAAKNATLSILMVTKDGTAKKVSAESFKDVRRSGIISIRLSPGDLLMSTLFVEKGDEVILATKKGQAIRFKESDIREMGRAAGGVRGMKMKKGDVLVGADVIKKDAKNAMFLVMMENGYGKRTSLKEHKTQKRGGSGIKTAKVNAKTGNLMAAEVVTEEMSQIITMSKKSQVVRVDLTSVPSLGRQTQGVRIMKLRPGDAIASLTCM